MKVSDHSPNRAGGAARLALAIETSNPGSSGASASVALGELGIGSPRVLGVEMLVRRHRHDDDLTPAIDRLVRAHGAAPSELARVAVSIGPGGYTGLRIALATAKMLARATGAELVGVPSALAAAWTAPMLPALVCLASKNEGTHASLAVDEPGGADGSNVIARTGRRSIGLRTIGVITADHPEIGPLVRRCVCVVADQYLPSALRNAIANAGVQISELSIRAESVLALSEVLPATDPMHLAPIYPREPDAVTQWRERRRGG